MQKERVRLVFYTISECGLYRFGKKKAEFGVVGDILSNLEVWCKGKPLQDTCTFEASRGILKAYCCDIVHNSHGDCLLITWNESAAKDGKILSINGKQVVGDVKIDTAKVPKDGIPGHPTYFWFIPSLNLVATIQIANQSDFERQPNGAGSLREYLLSFIAWYSKYAETSTDPHSGDILAKYKRTDGTEVLEKLYPKFDFKLERKESSKNAIIAKRHEITKIQRKSVLYANNSDDLSVFSRAVTKDRIC